MSEQLPRFLTIKQTCEALQIGKTTVYALIHSGELKAVRIGTRCTRIPLESINALKTKTGTDENWPLY